MAAKILRGPKKEILVKMSVGEYFWKAAKQYPERICQIDAYTDKKETFGTVLKRALRVSIQLKKMGLKSKDTVTICCRNTLDNIVPVLAAMFLGIYVSSIDPILEVFDTKIILTQVKPKVIFVIDDSLTMVEEAITALEYVPQIIVIGDDSKKYQSMYEMEKMETEEEKTFEPCKIDIRETAYILYSSGTTSIPKGILFSHLSALHLPCKSDEIIPLDDPVIQFSSLYWNTAVFFTSGCIMNAKPKIVGHYIKAEKFLELVDKYKIQFACFLITVVNDLINMSEDQLNKYDRSSIKYIVPTGTFIDAEQVLKLRKIFPNVNISQLYGSTEMGTIPTYWPYEASIEDYESKPGSVGIVGDNVELKIVDVETRQLLGPNQEGEILVKTPYVMNGYCTGDSSKVFDEDGFMKTGDLGYYDEDDYVYVKERLNEIFKFRHHRIFPVLIESVLLKHPAIKEAVVVGIKHQFDLGHPAACVVLKENAHASTDEICEYISKNMSDIYTLRGGIKFVSEIPKTPSGKPSRRAVRKMFDVI